MSDYTPDTDDIKRAYQEQCNHYYADCEIKPKEHANEFDRWLAEHDAEVAMAERERIMDLIGDGAAYLIAKGDLGSATLVALGKLEDMIGGKNE